MAENKMKLEHPQLLLRAALDKAGILRADGAEAGWSGQAGPCQPAWDGQPQLHSVCDNDLRFSALGKDFRLIVTGLEYDDFGELVSYLLYDGQDELLARASSRLYDFELDGHWFEHMVPQEMTCSICHGGCPGCSRARGQ